jgi:hypothetical protein
MRIDEISSTAVPYEKAVEEAAKVYAMTKLIAGDFNANTAQTVLLIAYPNRSINDRDRDWNEAVKRQLKIVGRDVKKQKFVSGLKRGEEA